MKKFKFLFVILLSGSLFSQEAFRPLVFEKDTIGFFKGTTYNPFRDAYLFKSNQSDNFIASNPDFDFKWASQEMTTSARIEWSPFPKLKSSIFEIDQRENYEGSLKENGTFYKMSNTAVVEKKGSAKELYQLTLNFINENYVSPEDVIKGRIESEYLRLQGVGKAFYFNPTLGFLDARYTLEFRFKEGRFKVNISNLEIYFPMTRYSSGGWSPYSFEVRVKNGKGKILKNGWRNMSHLKSYFNSLIEGLRDYSSMDDANQNEDDDW